MRKNEDLLEIFKKTQSQDTSMLGSENEEKDFLEDSKTISNFLDTSQLTKTIEDKFDDDSFSTKKTKLDKTISLKENLPNEEISFGSSQADILNEEWSLSCNSSNKKKENMRYKFLVYIRDAKKRKPNEEGYDPSTLYISEEDLNKMTPFEKQFWDVKRKYYDTVVFFKKGKFYELYEEDADLGAKLFNFRITERVNMRMAGFPESSFDEWMGRFLDAGYKVARVDQSENMIGKEIRERGGKKDKIIKRELKEIVTQGTIYDINHLKTPHSVFIAAIRENVYCYQNKCCTSPKHFSLLLYDASISLVMYSTFCDDEYLSNLRSIFIQNTVKEYLSDNKYKIPGIHVKCTKDSVAYTNRNSFEHDEEFDCFCYLYNYLKYLKRENSLTRLKIQKLINTKKNMFLNFSTISNMELFENTYNKKNTNTLFKSINFCFTPFGQRLLRNWMLYPLVEYEEILKRQQLSKFFEGNQCEILSSKLKELGDTERLLSNLNRYLPKLKDLNLFLESVDKLLNSLKICEKLFNDQKTPESDVIYIGSIYDVVPYIKGKSVGIESICELSNFLTDFNKRYRTTKDEIVPGPGTDDELCKLLSEKVRITKKMVEFLEEQKKICKCKDLSFKNIGKEIYQIDVPFGVKVPEDWYIISKTKTSNRYYNKEIKIYISQYVENEERIFQSQGTLLKRSVDYLLSFENIFNKAIKFVSILDCLISFSIFNMVNDTSVPKLSQTLSVNEIRNPIYKNYVTNDYKEDHKVLILTGPNMAGKSTFMRTLCLNIILFQMGLNVCAKSFEAPLFDKIFTRIGASDNLARGESTFMIELLETSYILQNATKNSFVILDELGRGTSANDGEGIAKAVINKLKKIDCRVFFSTHYHDIILDTENVSMGFMNTLIKDDSLLFLYKLVKGVCNDSNGIYVAKLAGVPEKIIIKAEEYKKKYLKLKSNIK